MRLFSRRKQGVVDFVAESPEGDQWMVAVFHHDPWDSEGRHLVGLQERINDCLAFITGGQMDEMYPRSIGKRRLVQVFYAKPPDAATAEFFELVSAALAAEGIAFQTEPIAEEA